MVFLGSLLRVSLDFVFHNMFSLGLVYFFVFLRFSLGFIIIYYLSVLCHFLKVFGVVKVVSNNRLWDVFCRDVFGIPGKTQERRSINTLREPF